MIKVSDYVIRKLEETGVGHMFMLLYYFPYCAD